VEYVTSISFDRGKNTMLKKDRKCPNCGCTEIIINARILDKREGGDDELRVAVDGKPNAFIFTDTSYGEMTACICSDCGFTEIYTANARELYQKSVRSQAADENTNQQ
jgi:predicted nucleic-acid-binding Zn-ribbon protein